ncbi:MAG: M20/M25/M40 family metallo-hydrolase [Bacteroidales bacterium]|nr:M20/M25/M40 family metallo-hydrolase [Bacteroidales bacterium]
MLKRAPYAFFVYILLLTCQLNAQNTDSLILRRFFTEALSNPVAYHNLNFLCTHIGGRLCGSNKAEEAVNWAEKLLMSMNPDTVYLQPVMVEHWERGFKETARITSSKTGLQELSVCALGSSVGTGPQGINAEVVEVHNFLELQDLGRKNIEGKIVFFNRAADPTPIYTFEAYGGAVDQRAFGAMQAARYGATAVIVRSATLAHDNYPHTGIQHYADSVKAIPALSVSTNDADTLSSRLKKDPNLKLFILTSCATHPESVSHNVIAEIKGTEHPNEVIAFGGHIDSWDIGQGAHDDGAGVVQTIEVLRLFKALGIKPRHTLRVIVFMDEEYAQRGAKAYAESAKQESNSIPAIHHLAAIESDRGGFTPQGFSIDAPDSIVKIIHSWQPLLQPYGLWSIAKGGSGVDIRDLKPQGVPLIALVSDSQRYFDYQHAASDTFDKVHPRELQLGSAAIAALVFLIDKYGL